MTVRLNHDALTHARGLVKRGETTHDDRDDWSEHAPTADEENVFIEKHGLTEYAKWYLGEDTEKPDDTKGRYLFPYGDFRKLHRCAVISAESRAGQHDHASIREALGDLLESIDKEKK